MKFLRIRLLIVSFVILNVSVVYAQLQVSNATNAVQLAQKLVGDGVTISNVSFSGSNEMAGFFTNIGGTNIGIDSGIVLTNGKVVSRPPGNGIVGPSSLNAHNQMGFPGDPDLSNIVSAATNDACVLEFDFIPLGDSIRFKYVFSSEEYPTYACSQFNDAFAFFVSGPGIPTPTNIALIPNSTAPVTITNINDQGCALYPQYYINNQGNPFFTHNGLTQVFIAETKVQPCQTYHLKLVIADVVDSDFDSGVFLQAKSLSSNVVALNNITQTDPLGNSYLAEGCSSFSFTIRRPRKEPTPLNVGLQYGGTAINGVDVQLLPASVIIPANDSFVVVNVIPIQDGIAEGVENLKIYALGGCSASTPADSIIVQIRDYDILDLVPDTAVICRSSSIQLSAANGYTTYQWNPDPTLSAINISNPIATPVNNATTYICTATQGTCNARDSVFLRIKNIDFVSKLDVNCRGAATGNIKVAGGDEWVQPVEFSLDGINWQADSAFNNLTAGTYWVKIRDAFCIDSVSVTISQAFPDLVINNTTVIGASCTGGADGSVDITPAGGNGPYQYSLDGINYQPGSIFNLAGGTYTIWIKDINNCTSSGNIIIPLNNTVTIDAGPETSICEGTSFLMQTTSNADTFTWAPAATLDDPTIKTPTATPADTTVYYVVATLGICSRTDSVKINVRPAPVANAGADIAVCFGKTFLLNGSGGVSYEWSPSTYITTSTSIASPTAKATANITYYLQVTDAIGCKSITPDEVDVTVTPAVKIFAGNDTIAGINQPIQLEVKELGSAGVTQYSWSPGTFLDNSTSATPIATLPYDYRYIVTGTTPEGCIGMDDVMIKVYKGPDIYVPSAFTPNNDGLNDVLKAVAVGIQDFKYLKIYNRWGQEIFSTREPSRGWDGRINGLDQPTGTYVWIAEAIDYKGNAISRKGVVTIIR